MAGKSAHDFHQAKQALAVRHGSIKKKRQIVVTIWFHPHGIADAPQKV